MKQFLVKLLGESGIVYTVYVKAEEKNAAYTRAKATIHSRSSFVEKTISYFNMEEGELTPTGWLKFYDVLPEV